MELISTAQAARASGLSETYIQKSAKRGKFPAQLLGKTWVFTREDFQKWLETRNTKRGKPR